MTTIPFPQYEWYWADASWAIEFYRRNGFTNRDSCHCGAVRFEADLDLAQSSYRCNCSICGRTRFWPAVARLEGFRLLSGESELTQYVFDTRKNLHYFRRGARL